MIVGACGDEIVDEDQKLANAQIDPEGELIEKECKVENFPKQKIGIFFVSPTDQASSSTEFRAVYLQITTMPCHKIRSGNKNTMC